MSAARTKAQSYIDNNSVVVFSKSWCSYSRASKQLLSNLGAKFEAVELDKMADGAEIQDALEEMTGQDTVPNIYIGQRHIGGNSDLQAKKKELAGLLKTAGAL